MFSASHSIARKALQPYAMREELRQSGLAAWESYQATGLHLTADEADTWLTKLEAGENCLFPECQL